MGNPNRTSHKATEGQVKLWMSSYTTIGVADGGQF